MPPGFSDSKKDEERSKYGDLIIWEQIIDKAKSTNQPLVLVTDDNKEDWWWQHTGRTIGPRSELRQEIRLKAKVDFYMYSSEGFMKRAGDYLQKQVKQEAIDEARSVMDHNERRMRDLERRQTPPYHYPRDYVARTLERLLVLRYGVPKSHLLRIVETLPLVATADDIVDVVEGVEREFPFLFLDDPSPDVLREISYAFGIPFDLLLNRHFVNQVRHREDTQAFTSATGGISSLPRRINRLFHRNDTWSQDDEDARTGETDDPTLD